YIYSALILTVALGGCGKLEEQPYGLVNTGSFYKTEADANSALAYAYAILPEVGYYSRGYYIITELPTENLTQKGDAGVSNFELDEIRTTPTNSDLDNLWTYLYRGVARANAVIFNVPNVQGIAEANKNQIVGEGYFLRALHNFNLVRLFGAVPLRTEIIADAGQVPLAKSTISEIYDLIISDLKSGEELMSAAKNKEGRANKVAAQALLSKVYLHLASSKSYNSPGYDFVTDAEAMYTEAKNYSGKVINEQSVFAFTNTLVDIWNTELYKAAGSVNEHIFDAAVDRTGDREGEYTKLPNMFLGSDRPMTISYNPSNPTSPTINIGQGWNHFRTEAGHYNSYANNDRRKTDLIVSSYTNSGTVYNLDINSASRPFSRKFLDPGRDADKMNANSPVIRYSDILLVYAEAAGPSEGYAAVNQVRTRANLGNLPPSLGVKAFRDAVVQERAWELAFEGNRLFDLRRTNGMEKMAQDNGKTITSGAYFFPIPQRELDT
ncbi:MAG: RagB/SusD family nutrient uptake outer membrane protein, partial [Pedobacter sp.]